MRERTMTAKTNNEKQQDLNIALAKLKNREVLNSIASGH